MTHDDTLAAFFAAEEAPARDVQFTLMVADRIANAELRRTLATRGAITVAIGAVAWGVAPLLGEISPVLTSPFVILGALVAGAGILLPKVLDRIPLLRTTRA